jgi:16S rRNA (cytidine1402-2'-O)-methyltransferase
LFLGFLPRQGRKRRDALQRVIASPDPCVLFESPQRLHKTLSELAELAPERPCTVCREISKLHEEIRRGTLAELAASQDEWRGEITLVVAASPSQEAPEEDGEALERQIGERLAAGSSVKTVVSELAASTQLSRRELYALVQQLFEALEDSAPAPTEPAETD